MVVLIEIKPTPRNKEAREDMPWNIFRDGRNTNVKPNKAEAEVAAARLRARYGCPADDIEAEEQMEGEHFVEKHYMDVPRPKGAPDKGRLVHVLTTDAPDFIGTVTDWLATQFIVEAADGATKIFLVTEIEWDYLD